MSELDAGEGIGDICVCFGEGDRVVIVVNDGNVDNSCFGDNDVGFIGLGAMGLGMATQCLKHEFKLVVNDIRSKPMKSFKKVRKWKCSVQICLGTQRSWA